MVGVVCPRRGRPVELRDELRLERRGTLDQGLVGGGPCQRRARRLLEQPHGVLRAGLEPCRIERAKQLGPAGHPGPAIVVGEPGERRQRRGQPLRQLGGGSLDVT